jgi:hypothetical protein
LAAVAAHINNLKNNIKLKKLLKNKIDKVTPKQHSTVNPRRTPFTHAQVETSINQSDYIKEFNPRRVKQPTLDPDSPYLEPYDNYRRNPKRYKEPTLSPDYESIPPVKIQPSHFDNHNTMKPKNKDLYFKSDGTPTTDYSFLPSLDNDGGLPLFELYDDNYTGPEYHIPFYNYMGPGTNVVKRISSLQLPINRADAVAMIHDIEYYGIPESVADANAVRNATGSLKILLKLAFSTKNLIAPLNPKKDLNLYKSLREIVETYPKYKKILADYDLKFYEPKADNFESEDYDFDLKTTRSIKSA